MTRRSLFLWSFVLIVALVGLKANAKPDAGGDNVLPLSLTLTTNKEMYAPRDNIIITATLSATAPVTVCLHEEHPDADFAVNVFRGGYGKLNAAPKVVQLDKTAAKAVERIAMAAGDTRPVAFSLKRMLPLPMTAWQPGEYRVEARFFLCGKTEGAEQDIPATLPAHFLIL